MNTSHLHSVQKSSKTDWTALISCFLASFILLGLLFIYGWVVIKQDQIFFFSDAVRRTIGIDFLFLSAIILLAGTPAALLFGCVGLYRTRKSHGRKGRLFALLGFIFSLIIIALVAWFLLNFEIAWSHFHLVM